MISVMYCRDRPRRGESEPDQFSDPSHRTRLREDQQRRSFAALQLWWGLVHHQRSTGGLGPRPAYGYGSRDAETKWPGRVASKDWPGCSFITVTFILSTSLHFRPFFLHGSSKHPIFCSCPICSICSIISRLGWRKRDPRNIFSRKKMPQNLEFHGFRSFHPW